MVHRNLLPNWLSAKPRWVIHRLAPLALLLLTSCSRGPAALRPPQVDAANAARAALAECDQNKDEQLTKEEWNASPALAAVAERYDANGGGTLDETEIRAGIEDWQANAVGPRQAPFTITLDGRPLTGAIVRLVPAAFLGDEVKPASGESGPGGGGYLSMSADDMPRHAPKMPLVQPGLYRVEITHPSQNIPARYNSQTTLGLEVTSATPGPEGIRWQLKSK